ncbi:MAG: hypothetical protein COA90_00940 [Gammaproteobacteria bacterium]|nr:MAG: hypothetical protein COA90_00940 [Gammaproteobacteria bacterium]
MSQLINSPEEVNDSVENNGFWPALSIAQFKASTRNDGTVEDSVIAFQLKGARLKVNELLRSYQTNEATPPEEGDDIEHLYFEAVYENTKAHLLEMYRDVDTRDKGHDRADRMTERVDNCYRNATVAINTILGNSSRFKVHEL